jgi:hypothetical protein
MKKTVTIEAWRRASIPPRVVTGCYCAVISLYSNSIVYFLPMLPMVWYSMRMATKLRMARHAIASHLDHPSSPSQTLASPLPSLPIFPHPNSSTNQPTQPACPTKSQHSTYVHMYIHRHTQPQPTASSSLHEILSSDIKRARKAQSHLPPLH